MNERIRELMLEAGYRFDVSGWPIVNYSASPEKLAELIVGECAGIVANAVDHREPASTYVSKIKQHFGVE